MIKILKKELVEKETTMKNLLNNILYEVRIFDEEISSGITYPAEVILYKQDESNSGYMSSFLKLPKHIFTEDELIVLGDSESKSEMIKILLNHEKDLIENYVIMVVN